MSKRRATHFPPDQVLKGKLYSINAWLRVTRFDCSSHRGVSATKTCYTGFLAWQQLGPYDELKFFETEHAGLLYLELVYLYKK